MSLEKDYLKLLTLSKVLDNRYDLGLPWIWTRSGIKRELGEECGNKYVQVHEIRVGDLTQMVGRILIVTDPDALLEDLRELDERRGCVHGE